MTPKKKRFCIFVILLLLCGGMVTFFYPKELIVGGLRDGPIGPEDVAYGEEYNCFGFTYNFTPLWPDYGGKLFCFGIRYNRQCFLNIGSITGVEKVKAECSKSPPPFL